MSLSISLLILYKIFVVERETYTYDEAFAASLRYFGGDELAARVWVNKYALKDSYGHIYEKTPDDMHWRLANELARIEQKYSNPLSAQELFDRSADGTLKEVMNVLHPVKGDFLTISPGIVHCAGNGLKVTVIKQASELPFRLSGPDDDGNCDNGDFVAEAMDFISYARYDTAEARMKADDMPGIAGERLAGCAEFNISRLRLQAPVKIHSQEQNGYAVYVCIEGEASVQARVAAADGKDTEAAFPLGKGTAMLVPAEVTDFILLPADRQTTLLEVTPGTREDIDGYINPDTEPFLEGEDYEGLENDDIQENDNVKEEGKHNRSWN